MRASQLDVLIPTFERRDALALTLTCLGLQTLRGFRVVVSDQGDRPVDREGAIPGLLRFLRHRGIAVDWHRHLPRRGMAEQRQFLLDRAEAPYALFLDDDVLLEEDLLQRLHRTIRVAGCGFAGSALVGLSFIEDERPHEQEIEFWNGPVRPERVVPGGPGWDRYRLHNAANAEHLRRRLEPTRDRLYKVAWVGGCVLFDVEKLRSAGGFTFWDQLPTEHAGEDVLAELRVMERFGGAGLFPSGAFHQEVPTTLPDRRVDAPVVMLGPPQAVASG
jgi:GT2 family glycosyltransferase